MIESNNNIINLILDPKELSSIDGQLVSEYISQLSALGVNSLNVETQRLSDLRSNVIEKTQQLAFNNYKTFISNGECAQTVTQDLNRIEDIVDEVIDLLPKLVLKCDSFSSEAKHISNRWQEVSKMLSKHPQILEVLEIPQLMDTCVRNNYYEESLQLYTYVHKLSKRYGESVPIISSIAKDVNVFKEIMINQLLKEISANIQLQDCLRIISFLRRIDKFSESELRIKFLSARDQWLNSIIKDIPTNNPLIHITKVIETNRVNLFDIVTQYRAIFSDSDPIVSQKHLYYAVTTTALYDRDFNDSAIINSWVLFKVQQFLDVLAIDLNRCVNNEFGHYYPIESIIEPSFYFGLSMSRIGADFRPQLIPIINDAISRRFARVVNEATNRFETSIQSFTLTSHAINTSVSLLVGADDQTENDLIPPTSLLEFPLLAQYCNDMLTAMNEIRRTTPLPAFAALTNTMNQSFQTVSNAIVNYFRAEESGLTANEIEILYRFCNQYIFELLPHLLKCFERIVPMTCLANKLGVTPIEFIKVKNVFPNLNLNSIADSVIRLMPTNNQTADSTQESDPIVPSSDNSDETSTEDRNRSAESVENN